MKRAFIVAAALACLVGSAAAGWAQAKPDFSGTWTFNASKSDTAPARMGGGMPGGGMPGGGMPGGGMPGGGERGMRGGGGGMMEPAASVTITQTPAQLSVDRVMGQGTQTAVYKLDGGESMNAMGPGEARSKASWDGAALVIVTTQTMQGRGGAMTIESKEIYSRDGDLLTILTTRSTPMGPQTRKLIYTRK